MVYRVLLDERWKSLGAAARRFTSGRGRAMLTVSRPACLIILESAAPLRRRPASPIGRSVLQRAAPFCIFAPGRVLVDEYDADHRSDCDRCILAEQQGQDEQDANAHPERGAFS